MARPYFILASTVHRTGRRHARAAAGGHRGPELNKRRPTLACRGRRFISLALIAPDGGTWKLSVDDVGALHTELVPR